MENVSTKTMKYSNRMPVFIIGVLMCVASIILYAIGYALANRSGVWIASVVVGAISTAMLVYAAHSYDGMRRMVAMFFMAVQIVFITIIATLYFSGASMIGVA